MSNILLNKACNIYILIEINVLINFELCITLVMHSRKYSLLCTEDSI